MLNPKEVLDHYYLDVRNMLIETGATLDRFDDAARREGGSPDDDERMQKIHDAINLLADSVPSTDRAERLLMLFSDPDEE